MTPADPHHRAGDADEGLWVEAIIGNDRVARWIDGIHAGKRSAVFELKAALEANPDVYVEEARQANVVHELTRLLGRTVDEEVMDAAAAIITACSGHMACGGKVRTFEYGAVHVAIREGMLGDGLGAKVWSTAHFMAKELVNASQLVKGRRVLEIGAGCGLNGIVAAHIGASEVVLTDVEGAVLRILAECVAMNATSAHGQVHTREQVPSDQELFDDAEEVDDLDELLGGGLGPAGDDGGTRAQPAWDLGNMHVRLLDWGEALREMGSVRDTEETPEPSRAGGAAALVPAISGAGNGQEEAALVPASSGAGKGQEEAALSDDGALPPREPAGTTYEVVLGNECMYEPTHAKLVAAVLAQRLAPGGCALLCSAVRSLRTFRTFRSQCMQRGLRYRTVAIDPACSGQRMGVTGRLSRDYEGGFLMIAVDHEASPFAGWHRDDFE